MKKEFKNRYLITSERFFSDETDVELRSNNEYKAGDIIILDGLRWYITEVLDNEAKGAQR